MSINYLTHLLYFVFRTNTALVIWFECLSSALWMNLLTPYLLQCSLLNLSRHANNSGEVFGASREVCPCKIRGQRGLEIGKEDEQSPQPSIL